MTADKAEKPKKSGKKQALEQAQAPAELPPVGSAARKALILQGLIKE
jgi:hypothetical protein